MEYIFVTRNMSESILGEQSLLEKSIPVRLMPLPPKIKLGCGVCLRVDEVNLERAREVLADAGLDSSFAYIKKESDYEKVDFE